VVTALRLRLLWLLVPARCRIGWFEGWSTTDPSIAALAGCTPVTKASGKHKAVHFRWACNKRFRQAMATFADNSRHESPWAAHIYNQARAAGKDHPHAVRILARAWIRVIWRCWQDDVPYDPAQHGAAATLTKPSAA
jgi:Transposase IS116/IS110/IS902 family